MNIINNNNKNEILDLNNKENLVKNQVLHPKDLQGINHKKKLKKKLIINKINNKTMKIFMTKIYKKKPNKNIMPQLFKKNKMRLFQKLWV